MAKSRGKSRSAPARDEDDERSEEAAPSEGDADGAADEAQPDDDVEVLEVMGEPIGDEDSFEDVDGLESAANDRALARLDSSGHGSSLARLDPLQTYMREVQQHPLLTREEEHELAVRYTQTGDVKAAARLVTANLRLVVKLAYEYRRAYRNMMDLIQEGNIGLMQAVKRYDPYRGVKLSSYSAWWIRAYMLRFILNNWRLVKLGTTQAQRKLFFNLSREKAKLASMGIEPTDEEIAKRLDVDAKDVREMDRRLARNDASLDVPIGDADGKPTTRLELLPATSRGPEQLTESAELSELVRRGLDEFRRTLSDKDLKIFDLRMVADEPLTLQQLGDEFGVSRERVRQLEARITGRLRDYLRDTIGDAVLVGGG